MKGIGHEVGLVGGVASTNLKVVVGAGRRTEIVIDADVHERDRKARGSEILCCDSSNIVYKL